MISHYLQREWVTPVLRVIVFENQYTGLIECFIAQRLTPAHPWGPFHKAQKV